MGYCTDIDLLVDQYRLSGIVVIDHTFEEKQSGFQRETSETALACIIEGEPWLARFVEHKDYAPRSGPPDRSLNQIARITPLEYEELKAKHGGVRDTAQYHERRRAAERAAAELRTKLEGLTPRCPRCDVRMKSRSGKHGPFWSCSRFPTCEGTRSMTTAVSKELENLTRELVALPITTSP